MPHLTIEYSANLEESGNMDRLCIRLANTLHATGVFELGAIRVRALPCRHYAIADMLPSNAFVALILRIGAGRSLEVKQAVGAALMAEASDHFVTQLAGLHFALSLDILENDPELSWKVNKIHNRLRG